jgi:predicted nucleic acid-binding protein
MHNAISNTSPLLYLYRIDALDWLPKLFGEIWTPRAVIGEVGEGRKRGYDVPLLESYEWLKIIKPSSVPSEWLSLDLGAGELETMALALENPGRVAILDDALARRIAQAAGLNIWGTLKVLLEAKEQGITKSISPHVEQLKSSGMWISEDIRLRILALAGE